ncbi:MAG: ATP-binding cassette domain-containing protein [Myxococcota bacterium]
MALLSPAHRRQLVLQLALLATVGAAMGLVLPLVHESAFLDTDSDGYRALIGALILALGVLTLLFRYCSVRLTTIFEDVLLEYQDRLITRIRSTELRSIEQCPHLVTQYTRSLEKLVAIRGSVIQTFNAVLKLVTVAAYLAVASPLMFIAITGILAFLARHTYQNRTHYRQTAIGVHDERARSRSSIERLLEGFVLFRLDERAGQRMVAELQERFRDWGRGQVQVQGIERRARVATHTALLAAIWFLLGRGPGAGLEAVTVILFASILINNIDRVSALTIARLKFEELEGILAKLDELLGGLDPAPELDPDLDAHLGLDPAHSRDPLRPLDFSTISLRGVEYDYGDPSRFSLGPLDLSLRRGELLFVIGNNGSGKSTVMKLLSGLYWPQAGGLYVDGQRVERSSAAWYRALFTVVFADQRLFDRLYGLEDASPQELDRLLQEYGLREHLTVTDGAFSTIDLSAGQKKRLAMIVARLEGRPVMILDEWAASQDPHARAAFYEQMLPRLRDEGRTLVVVTHDDRFFHLADRVVRLDAGRIVEQTGTTL